jgi:hypothetical protein
MGIRWVASLAPEIVPTGLLLLCFFFPDKRSGLHRPAISSSLHHQHYRGQGCRCALQAAAAMLVIKPPSPASPPFQAVAPPMLLVLTKLALGPSPRLLPHARGHRR